MHVRRMAVAAFVVLLTAASHDILAQGSAAPISRSTRHVKFTATVAPRTIEPGDRLTVTVDVAPKPGMHVYAPGTKYRVVKVTFEPHPLLTIGEVVYPPSTPYYFKPLNETEPVYQAPFRLVVEMTVAATDRARSTMTLKGTLDYQACDDRVCYLPESIPLRWTLRPASS